MTQLWNQRFDALERVLETEKKNLETNEMEGRSTIAHQQTQRKEVTITRLFDAPRSMGWRRAGATAWIVSPSTWDK